MWFRGRDRGVRFQFPFSLGDLRSFEVLGMGSEAFPDLQFQAGSRDQRPPIQVNMREIEAESQKAEFLHFPLE